MIRPRPLLASSALALVLVASLGACTDNSSTSASDPGSGSSAKAGATVEVESTADACTLSTAEVTSGSVSFTVSNKGTEVTEFYLYAEDGTKVMGEAENIGPGTSRDLVVDVAPGSYVTACKPGMVGDGIRAPFTVTG